MKKLLVALFGAALVLGACGGDGDDKSNDTGDSTGVDVAKAESSYKTCAACHGENLEGGSAPGIKGLSKDEVLAAIKEGRQTDKGVMPANMITGADAENLAAWVAEQ